MKTAQRLIIILLSLGILVNVVGAQKKNDKKDKEPKIGPFIDVEVSTKIMKCIDDYDKLKASMLKVYAKRDNNWNHNDLKKYKDKIGKLKKKIEETIERENKASISKAKSVTKEIEDLEKKLEKEKSEKKQDEMRAKIETLVKQQGDLDMISAQYNVFSRYCNAMRRNPSETDLQGTALECRGKNMPKIGEAGDGYYAIVFCASKNKDSMSAVKSVEGLGLSKVIVVACDDDEALFKKNFGKEKPKLSYVRDADFSIAQKHNVIFLPTIYVGNKGGKCIYAMSGTSSKQLSLIKKLIKEDEKEADKGKKEANKAK